MEHICIERVIRVNKITGKECHLTVDVTDDLIVGYIASSSEGIDEYKLRDFLKDMFNENWMFFDLKKYYDYYRVEIIDYYFDHWFTEEEEWEDANDYYDGWEFD